MSRIRFQGQRRVRRNLSSFQSSPGDGLMKMMQCPFAGTVDSRSCRTGRTQAPLGRTILQLLGMRACSALIWRTTLKP
ncbi:MAG: hypothetical protein RLZZ280_762 [Pseudomonadota bacterium]